MTTGKKESVTFMLRPASLENFGNVVVKHPALYNLRKKRFYQPLKSLELNPSTITYGYSGSVLS